MAIEPDFLYSRQYISALHKKEFLRLRADKIIEVEILKDTAESVGSLKKKSREIKLRVHFQNFEERTAREKILREEFDTEIFDEGENFFICAIKAEDPLQFYPKLWQFQTWAKILLGADGLRERMKNDM